MAYIDAIKDLEKKLFDFNPQAEKIYNLINDLKTFIPAKEETLEYSGPETRVIKLVFDRNLSANEQVLFALRYIGKISKASEIISAIKEFDASFDKGLSTPFYKLRESNLISVFNPTITADNPTGSNHQVYYGLKEWFNGDNKVRSEFLPKELEYIELL